MFLQGLHDLQHVLAVRSSLDKASLVTPSALIATTRPPPHLKGEPLVHHQRVILGSREKVVKQVLLEGLGIWVIPADHQAVSEKQSAQNRSLVAFPVRYRVNEWGGVSCRGVSWCVALLCNH